MLILFCLIRKIKKKIKKKGGDCLPCCPVSAHLVVALCLVAAEPQQQNFWFTTRGHMVTRGANNRVPIPHFLLCFGPVLVSVDGLLLTLTADSKTRLRLPCMLGFFLLRPHRSLPCAPCTSTITQYNTRVYLSRTMHSRAGGENQKSDIGQYAMQ